jgi:hypothetical protein
MHDAGLPTVSEAGERLDMLGAGLVTEAVLAVAPHPARSSASHNDPIVQAAREAALIATLMV